MNGAMTIGDVAKASGVPAKTIRYYEDAGLISPADRAANGYRVYDERALQLLRFVKRARDLGFSMADVGELLALWQDQSRQSADVRGVAERHLDAIERKMAELDSLRRVLRDLVQCCHGDDRPDCPILDELAGGEQE
jgi:MerR family copper efflux transcriptional regulator